MEKFKREEFTMDSGLELLYMRKTQAEIEREEKDKKDQRDLKDQKD